MENLRNSDGSSSLGSGSDPDYVEYEDSTEAVEPPPAIGQDERRMHVRAYNFWAGLLGDRQFPNVEDLHPETDTDFGPNSVLLDFTNGVENPTIQFLGQALREECELDEHIEQIEDVPARSLLSRITDHYLQIIANQAPIGFEAEFVNQRGVTIMYRGILLPFSTDDDTIDFIYGVINWKEVAADEFVQELENQVTEAMRSAPEKTETGPIWADGPATEELQLSPEQELPSEIPPGNDLPTVPEVAEEEPVLPAAVEEAISLDEISDTPDDDASLADWLVAARSSAENALHCEKRSRAALYDAIGQAYDFYLMTEAHPEDYQILLEDSGLKAQERAPMTPIVKLVFGALYDKTRLTEYAAALRYAKQHSMERGSFAGFLDSHEGGLKAVVYAERDSRKPASEIADRVAEDDAVRNRLRAAPVRQLAEIDAGDSEFVVLVARRQDDGQLAIVGPVVGDEKLTDRVLRKTQI